MEIFAQRTSRSGKTFIPDLPPDYLKKLKSLLGSNFKNKEELIEHLLKEVKIVTVKNQRRKIAYFHRHTKNQVKYELSCKIFSDLISAGWDISIGRKTGLFILNKPVFHNKEDKKKVYLNKRNERILEPSVQKFLQEMESPKSKTKKSIFEIVDSGKELSDCFQKINKLPEDKKIEELKKLIKPEIAMVWPRSEQKKKFKEEEHLCPITNLKLNDIWRYFRYTWSSVADTNPGRSVQIIIRNAARKNKPVMGIALLRNGELGDSLRDNYIGWSNIDLIREKILKKEINAEVLIKNLIETIQQGIENLKLDDLPLLNAKNLKKPDELIINKLKKILEKETFDYEKFQEKRSTSETDSYNKLYKKKVDEEDWKWLSVQTENRLKRIEHIIDLLNCRIVFNKVNLSKNSSNGLAQILVSKNPKDKQYLNTAVRFYRELKLNNHGMDIGVCGPIDPYGEILGGKLITLLMSSKEVYNLFKKRYNYYKSPSTITSTSKGQSVFRNADLLFLTVSSLYGNSSIYNRIKLTKDEFPELKKNIELKELKKNDNTGKTKGQGINHYSSITTKLIQILRTKKEKYTAVKGRFGQGAGAKMRKTRGGLDILFDKNKCTIREDDFVEHSITKKKYIFTFVDDLLRYFLNNEDKIEINSSKDLTSAWIKRWISKRILRKETIENIKLLGPASIKKNLSIN